MPISILALAALMAAQDPAPAAPQAEAERAADLHARAIHRCETTPRGQNETVQACADRRVAALMDTYGTTARALGATAGWLPDEAGPTTGRLGFPTIADGLAPDTQASPRPQRAYQPPQSRCRRESTRSEDGSRTSTTVICGAGGAAEQAVRDTLDRLSRP